VTDHPSGYATADALWAAVTARSKTAARTTGATVSNLLRQFVYDRFLARVFTHSPDGTWVLKGGTALLARVRSARHSLDVDLFRRTGSLDHAVAEIRAAAGLDLDDHLRFVVGDTVNRRTERAGQPGSELATLAVQTYAGVRDVQRFSVDIVIGSVITGDPEPHRPASSISVPGLSAPPYLLYPVADHVADKLCATVELHGPARVPSSRHRDLVVLVVIARTQTVDADAPRLAITTEVDHRRLPSITRWATPEGWATTYPRAARDVPECRDHRDFATATTLVSDFLDPVLAHGLTTATWHPDRLDWAQRVQVPPSGRGKQQPLGSMSAQPSWTFSEPAPNSATSQTILA
jgi:hypothetical protein